MVDLLTTPIFRGNLPSYQGGVEIISGAPELEILLVLGQGLAIVCLTAQRYGDV